MDNKKRPVLSIGIIFKNEIRCLERCLGSLWPLRNAVLCQLVMADTGSTDGSREIAARYADVLFDFPWINDFSAARNAVMDRCFGEWFLSIDCDEWLDEDMGPLTFFLTHPKEWKNSKGALFTIRNYAKENLAGDYSDFQARRLLRMSTGIRFEGAIHEHWPGTGGGTTIRFLKPILHHDGYAAFTVGRGRAKRDRNMSLLKLRLEKEPDDLRTRLECFESTEGMAEGEDQYLRLAVQGIENQLPKWESYGPIIYRYAVQFAQKHQLPELPEWAARSWELFPDSLFTRIDVSCTLLQDYYWKKEYDRAIFYGEKYLQTLADYRAGQCNTMEMVYSALNMTAPEREDLSRTFLADAYFHEKRYLDAWDTLSPLDGSRMNAGCVENYISILMNIHSQSEMDLSSKMSAFWTQTITPNPQEMAEERRRAILRSASRTFKTIHRIQENVQGVRHAYTLFLPLAEQFVLGTAAAMLETEDRVELARLLGVIENWGELPIDVLEHALACGVQFPLSEKPLRLEEMDLLAGRLDAPRLSILVANGNFTANWQSLLWARGLALASVQSYEWKNEGKGLELARVFAKVEKAFLPRYYSADLLYDENALVLPPMHRFGWYCVQAFDALESGSPVEYVRMLRKGLAAAPAMKAMVEFLTENTPEIQTTEASPELLVLAEQVRTMLAAYDPEDPTVRAIRESPVYQRVAYLIESDGTPGRQ